MSASGWATKIAEWGDSMNKLLGVSLLLLTMGASPLYAQNPEGTWHGERAGVRFHPSGENIAYDKPAPTVHPNLTEHSL